MKVLTLALACFAFSVFAEDLPIGTFEKSSADGWTFYNGKEFPGAQGSFAIVEDSGFAARLEGFFSGGGIYVSINKSLAKPMPFKALKLKVKTSDYSLLTLRLIDGSGQTHQQSVALKADGEWQTVTLKDFKGAAYSKWGGANDGTWHDPLKGVSLLLERRALKDEALSGTAFFSGIALEE